MIQFLKELEETLIQGKMGMSRRGSVSPRSINQIFMEIFTFKNSVLEQDQGIYHCIRLIIYQDNDSQKNVLTFF